MYRYLNAECARAGITKEDLAKKILNISPSTLWRKTKLRDGFKVNEAIKIQEALNSSLSINKLFEFDDCDELREES